MTRTEAIALLASCRALAAKLTAFGINIQLDKDDYLALENFYQIWEAGWVADFRTHRLAGLSRDDVMALNSKLQKVMAEGS